MSARCARAVSAPRPPGWHRCTCTLPSYPKREGTGGARGGQGQAFLLRMCVGWGAGATGAAATCLCQCGREMRMCLCAPGAAAPLACSCAATTAVSVAGSSVTAVRPVCGLCQPRSSACARAAIKGWSRATWRSLRRSPCAPLLLLPLHPPARRPALTTLWTIWMVRASADLFVCVCTHVCACVRVCVCL
jgi:hypothetical protein